VRKNFDEWNKMKKKIDRKSKGRFYHEGEVWWCNIGLNIGNEQHGDYINFKRPVIVIKGLSLMTFFAIPLTTSQQEHKYRFDVGLIGGKQAKAIISQMKVVDTKRLSQLICVLAEDLFQEIKKAIKDLF